MDQEFNKELSVLFTLAKIDTSPANLQRIDSSLEQILKAEPNLRAYMKYNDFRIANLTKLPRTRPQILVGGPFEVNFPNLHTLPLFSVADVICIAPSKRVPAKPSFINCQTSDLFFDILTRLPIGFEPDFYWDNQVELKHYIPSGIHTAPFPIVASVCHSYNHKSIEYICDLFDLVVAMSKQHAQILRKLYPSKIIELPFGLNWGSLNHVVKPLWEKSRDVCLTFLKNDFPYTLGKRNEVTQWLTEFKQKYGDRFSITIIDDYIPTDKYMNILRESRISVNVVSVHGPYNYRTVETMCAGSMVFQYDWDDPFFKNRFSEVFVDGVHGVSFNADNFEKKLLYYLENPHESEKIARAGYEFVKENYSYQKLFQDLIKTVKNSNVQLPRDLTRHVSYFQADMIYYYQNTETIDKFTYAAIDLAKEPLWIRCNNLMIFAAMTKSMGVEHLLLMAMSDKEISRIKRAEIKQLCMQFYAEAMEQAPKEMAWIIRWNFLMIRLERSTVEQSEIKSLLTLLESTNPEPFNEKKVMFKYYIDSPHYQKYRIPNREFINLNLALLKDIDDPKKRAGHYLNYAIEALRQF